jgi:hydroxypyruvate isomerase
MLRFAANLSFLYGEYEFPERFAAAAKDGFTGVEYLFPYNYPAQQLATRLQENGLVQVLFNAPPGNWAAGERGLASLPGREAEFQTAIQTALAYAQTLNCPRVHVMAGLQPSGVERAAMHSTFVANLAWAAELTAPAGIELLIEPINTRDIPGYFLNRQDEAHAIVDEIGNPVLKVQMDLYHCQIVEGDVSMKLRKYLVKNVGHLQIASVPDRNEPDGGELNYDYLLGLIEELGYNGWIGCEYRPKAGTSEGLGWLKKRRSGVDENLLRKEMGPTKGTASESA